MLDFKYESFNSMGIFQCNNVKGFAGREFCSSNPYEPSTCAQAAALQVLEPTCTGGGSMNSCAYNLTFAMMTAGGSESYVYLGRGNESCPLVQGYAIDGQNEAKYWVEDNSNATYSMRNIDGKLKLTYGDCQADVDVLSGSFLGVKASGHGDDNRARNWGEAALSFPVFFVMAVLGHRYQL